MGISAGLVNGSLLGLFTNDATVRGDGNPGGSSWSLSQDTHETKLPYNEFDIFWIFSLPNRLI